MSEYKTRLQTQPKATLNAVSTRFLTLNPLERTLKLLDELLLTRKQPVMAAIGLDGYAQIYPAGPFRLTVYPYETLF